MLNRRLTHTLGELITMSASLMLVTATATAAWFKEPSSLGWSGILMCAGVYLVPIVGHRKFLLAETFRDTRPFLTLALFVVIFGSINLHGMISLDSRPPQGFILGLSLLLISAVAGFVYLFADYARLSRMEAEGTVR